VATVRLAAPAANRQDASAAFQRRYLNHFTRVKNDLNKTSDF
jgi:hypothetical protein